MMREYENYEETAYRPEYWEDEEDTPKTEQKKPKQNRKNRYLEEEVYKQIPDPIVKNKKERP